MIANIVALKYFPQAVPNATLFPLYLWTPTFASIAMYSISDLWTAGQLLEMITSLASPLRMHFLVQAYPKVHFPLFITRANRLLMLSWAFFVRFDMMRTRRLTMIEIKNVTIERDDLTTQRRESSFALQEHTVDLIDQLPLQLLCV